MPEALAAARASLASLEKHYPASSLTLGLERARVAALAAAHGAWKDARGLALAARRVLRVHCGVSGGGAGGDGGGDGDGDGDGGVDFFVGSAEARTLALVDQLLRSLPLPALEKRGQVTAVGGEAHGSPLLSSPPIPSSSSSSSGC